MAKFINDISNSEYIRNYLTKYIFLVLSEKPGALEWEDHITIHFMNKIVTEK